MKCKQSAIAIALTCTCALLANATLAATILFDDLADGEDVGTRYSGLTFSNASVLQAGISLNEFEFPPRSGDFVAFDSRGPMGISFSSAISQFQAFFTYALPLQLTAYDANANPIAVTGSLFANNLALSGDLGSAPNEVLFVSSQTAIWSVKIFGDPNGGSFAMDDLSYVVSTPVPEPDAALLLSAGLLVATGVVRRRRSRSPSADSLQPHGE